MALKEPKSMDDCVYFTNRTIGEGSIKAWVLREMCPKCKKALMGKPKAKNGKVKSRALFYVCPECGHTMEKEAYEDTLQCSVLYRCPHCKHEGDAQVPFERKKVQRFDEEKMKKVSVDVIRFQCGKCGQNIDISKKMK